MLREGLWVCIQLVGCVGDGCVRGQNVSRAHLHHDQAGRRPARPREQDHRALRAEGIQAGEAEPGILVFDLNLEQFTILTLCSNIFGSLPFVHLPLYLVWQVAMKFMQADQALLEKHYADLSSKPFFPVSPTELRDFVPNPAACGGA